MERAHGRRGCCSNCVVYWGRVDTRLATRDSNCSIIVFALFPPSVVRERRDLRLGRADRRNDRDIVFLTIAFFLRTLHFHFSVQHRHFTRFVVLEDVPVRRRAHSRTRPTKNDEVAC